MPCWPAYSRAGRAAAIGFVVCALASLLLPSVGAVRRHHEEVSAAAPEGEPVG